MQEHDHITRPNDDEAVRDIKSQIDDPRMLTADYWIEEEESILEIKPVEGGIQLIYGV